MNRTRLQDEINIRFLPVKNPPARIQMGSHVVEAKGAERIEIQKEGIDCQRDGKEHQVHGLTAQAQERVVVGSFHRLKPLTNLIS